MKIFKWHIISEKDFYHYRRCHQVNNSVHLVYRWFSGWKDLDIIWNYILSKNQKTIEDTRREYALTRGTDEYGNMVHK